MSWSGGSERLHLERAPVLEHTGPNTFGAPDHGSNHPPGDPGRGWTRPMLSTLWQLRTGATFVCLPTRLQHLYMYAVSPTFQFVYQCYQWRSALGLGALSQSALRRERLRLQYVTQ